MAVRFFNGSDAVDTTDALVKPPNTAAAGALAVGSTGGGMGSMGKSMAASAGMQAAAAGFNMTANIIDSNNQTQLMNQALLMKNSSQQADGVAGATKLLFAMNNTKNGILMNQGANFMSNTERLRSAREAMIVNKRGFVAAIGSNVLERERAKLGYKTGIAKILSYDALTKEKLRRDDSFRGQALHHEYRSKRFQFSKNWELARDKQDFQIDESRKGGQLARKIEARRSVLNNQSKVLSNQRQYKELQDYQFNIEARHALLSNLMH